MSDFQIDQDQPDFTDKSPVASPNSRFERSVSPSGSASSYESATSTAATSITGEDLNEKLGFSQQQPDVTEGITPESLSNPVKDKKKKDGSLKKNPNKTSSRISSNTGISSAVPVTGERPRPTEHASLEDNVFFTIFQILHDHDPETKGMTVKQICDVLAEAHPEMAKLSTKTSNLVSAKLNAYVKRVEKGEREIIYALSRQWADASPKRMVYVYRGLLTPDYYITAKQLWQKLEAEGNLFPDRSKDEEKKLKKEEKKMLAAAAAAAHSGGSATPGADLKDSSSVSTPGGMMDVSSSSSPVAGGKQRRATMFDLGINRGSSSTSSFSDASMELRIPTLSVPYQVAPVTAALSQQPPSNSTASSLSGSGSSTSRTSSNHSQQARSKLMLLKTRDEFDLDEEFDTFYENDDEFDTRVTFRDVSKRSKSMSFISNKKGKYVTAAAAAPRVPRTPVAVSPSQAAQAAALHAAAFKELSPTTASATGSLALGGEADEDFGLKTLSVSSPSQGKRDRATSFVADVSVSAKWLQTVRSGFMTQEIRIPEEVSLTELDSMFS